MPCSFWLRSTWTPRSSTNGPDGGAAVDDIYNPDLFATGNDSQLGNCFDALAGEFAGAHGAKLGDGQAGLADLYGERLEGTGNFVGRGEDQFAAHAGAWPEMDQPGADERSESGAGGHGAQAKPDVDGETDDDGADE